METDWNNGYLRPRKPHFFQIILKDGEATRQQKLWIPRRFMKDYGSEISKHVQVKDPSGRKWNLEWSKRDGEVWFKKGWQDFADYYSLKHGHFLVFQYEGNSHFTVIILDMTATEINYPIFRTDENVGEIKKEVEDQEYENTLDDSSPSLSRKRKESLPRRGRGRPKKRRTILPSKPESNSKMHISNSGERCNKSVKKHRGNGTRKNTKVSRDDENAEDLPETCASTKSNYNNLKNSSRNTCRVSKTQEFTTFSSLNKLRDFKKVADLKSKNLSFDVILKPADVTRNYMAVPFQFARYHFKEKSGKVILQISEKKTWTVGYTMYNTYSYSRLVYGWPAFARENNLKAGVKCLFKLINHDELILKVVIVRANTSRVKSENIAGVYPCSPRLQHSHGSCKERGKQGLCDHKCRLSSKNVTKLTGSVKVNSLSRAKTSFQSANPNFMVVLQPTYVEKRLVIPFQFAKTHFKRNSEIVLQQEDGSISTVDCTISRQRRVACFRSKKWNAFARINNLEVGDVCIFELLRDEEVSLRVFIMKNGSMRGVRADSVDENLVDPKTEYDSTSSDAEEIAAMRNSDENYAGRQELYEEKACRQRPSRPQRRKVSEAANKFISSYPYFKARITFCNFQSGVTVPVEFMRQTNLADETELTFQLQVGEKRWPVKYLWYPQYKVSRLAIGWSVFAKQSFLRVGDICAFELVDTESLLLKVTIFSSYK